MEYIYDGERLIFTEEMRKEYTILVPMMAPYHFDSIVTSLNAEGFNAELLKTDSYDLIKEGLRYSHNDICVPAMLVIGQFINAIKSGKYDIDKLALVITQTGGGCRASNYVNLLRKSLLKAGYPKIPVISLNSNGFEPNPGFIVTYRLGMKFVNSVVIGDIIMQLFNETKPYEVNDGDTELALEKVDILKYKYFSSKKLRDLRLPRRLLKEIIDVFKKVEVTGNKKHKVGIVGEIYVKYSPLGNNNLEKLLLSYDCEVVTPPLFDFFLYSIDSAIHDVIRYGGSFKKRIGLKILLTFLESRRTKIRRMLQQVGYTKPVTYKELKKFAKGVIDYGTHSGEGWLLTAEMIDLIHSGAPNIICTQPFGCLPNHIVGKGMFKRIKELHPTSNIVAIDYDTSASYINQINRIKLMLSNMRK